MYVRCIMSEFYPSINGISLRNCTFLHDITDIIRVRGDIYYNDICIGQYDPIQHFESALTDYMFLRIDSEYKYLWDQYLTYSSQFEYGIKIDEETMEQKVGLGVLMSDLELLVLMYDAWSFRVKENTQSNYLVGIINGDIFNVVAFKDPAVKEFTSAELIKYITEHVKPIELDNQSPIHFFRTINDFTKIVL